ncbi:4-aminobutyrate aminotransferase [Propionibacterium cyclohexanicum]|uniref:4-aminobutyrate aminotransferase n=1 Tax=Propionibacterium cyclohexanicum TaxID=64702 RepID=A0A1H9Q094_9ACTN|nr:aminotransferase class III-fold pyridoxal phosphate-dependent enzyme [Propionibacterium cyclohexanicum]SER53830.1 4-aminobutyrate aminotransferase [Propionibacterium cyclohexanicum]
MTAVGYASNGQPRKVEAHSQLLGRRIATLGPYSPLFYREPLELVSGSGVWVSDRQGQRYLDAYNNVPHVGHSNPRVREAVAKALGTININSRYLTEQPIAYAERLLATFAPQLDRVMFTNSGSESNELALRIARQHTASDGVLISDFSYHGNTTSLAQMTTGLQVAEPLGDHVRPIRIPDVPQDASAQETASLVSSALAEVDRAIDLLTARGHRLSAVLLDPSFSTEGLPRVPVSYLRGLVERVHKAGGLYIADEVQSGFGRLGSWMWGHQRFGVDPDLVTLGKPMGNGIPIGAVVLPDGLLEEFGSRNQYFNTFATTAVPSSAAQAVLDVMADEQLAARAEQIGRALREDLTGYALTDPFVSDVRGQGLYLGIELTVAGEPAPALAGWLSEALRERGVLASRIGRHDNVMKVRPPLVFGSQDARTLASALEDALAEAAQGEWARHAAVGGRA